MNSNPFPLPAGSEPPQEIVLHYLGLDFECDIALPRTDATEVFEGSVWRRVR